MKERVDNYQIQAAQAKKLFLGYDQRELIQRCALAYDETYFYPKMLSQTYRLHRKTGDLERMEGENWVDANTFAEVMTLLDWLCDSRQDRYITGRWANMVSLGHSFHRNLQEDGEDRNAALFDANPAAFRKACVSLGGEAMDSGDISYAIELLDGLRILVQLWHGDEEFPPRVRCLWDENALRYIRYETTYYAAGLLMARIRQRMEMEV